MRASSSNRTSTCGQTDAMARVDYEEMASRYDLGRDQSAAARGTGEKRWIRSWTGVVPCWISALAQGSGRRCSLSGSRWPW